MKNLTRMYFVEGGPDDNGEGAGNDQEVYVII